VPAQQRKQPALTGAQAAELAQLGVKIEQFYGMPMDVEWALSGGRFAIVQARPITALPPEWKSPIPGAIYARGSLAEHIPGPVTPLFATLGLELANEATLDLWRRMFGQEGLALIADSGFYLPINSYVYGGMRMGGKDLWTVLKISFSQIKPFMGGSLPRWHEARRKLAAVVETWQAKPVDTLAAAELYEGVRAVFGAACRYFTDIQTTLPAASMSEMAFTRLYNTLLRRKGGPDASRFLLGFENASLRSEKSLFNLAAWLKTDPTLANTILQTPTADLLEKLKAPGVPQRQPDAAWQEFSARFQRHLASFGSTAYEFDFANPTPLEAPGPLLDALKGFLNGSAQDPNARQREAIEQREQSTSAVLSRTGWPVRGWFQKVLHWAQETAPMREDAIFDMGMGHPLVRRMLGELGKRCAAGGAIDLPDDIYWLEKSELEELIQALDEGRTLPRMCEPIPARKAQWQASLKINAPVMVPERSGWMKFIHGGEAMRRDGKIILKGVGTSGGTITAPACVLYGPEDFGSMKPGCILVAVTTTPAWTPLFAMAAAVVTDIGGPLSHSSIVAREYGIPAVMATRSATRAIRTGQSITVDGSAGTVTVLSDNGHE
jgi:pyruvate,water dikinase